jgi:hypothetical protein
MTFLDRTKGVDSPPTWFVAETDHGSTYSQAVRSRDAALDAFAEHLAAAVERGESYTPFTQARRLLVTGPDWMRLPWNPTDPLLIGDVALRDALTPAEYQLYVTGPVAAALLES